MIKRYSVLFVALCSFSLLTQLFAGTTGKISGKVTDTKTGEGIPSAVVTIAGTTLGAATDANGMYVIVNVPPGTYSVSVNYIGYQPTRTNNVGVNVDYTTTLNIQMRESAVELGEFVVEGERNPLIRQDQTNPVIAVTADNIQALPVTSISQVIGLQAGVVVADDGAIHVRGGRDNEISFTLNGISVNNPYDNFSSIGVATNAVQEVTVSTGTFSAEYGNALSGIVNYVTKEGGAKNTGSLRVLTGDYLSRRDNVFPHIKEFDALNNTRVEATFGGPTFLDNLTFYSSGVYDRGKGFLYGTRLYNTTDFFVTRDEFLELLARRDMSGNNIPDPANPGYPIYHKDSRLGQYTSPYYFNPLNRQVQYYRPGNASYLVPYFDSVGAPTGDGAIVPMNPSESFNVQGNISYRISSTMKLKYEAVYDQATSKSASSYYNSYRFNPDGMPTNYSNGLVQALDWTHTLSNSAFYTIKVSINNSNDKTYTFEDLNDPRYLPGFYQTPLQGVGFLTGGTNLARTFRTLQSIGGKFDLQTQLFEVHEVKLGFEIRRHELTLEDYAVEFYAVNKPDKVISSFKDIYNDSLTYAARKPNIQSGYTYYKKTPVQVSAYIQDKIELEKSLILNAGLRYEYFDPSSKYNPNLSSAIANKEDNTFFLTKDLTQAEPRHNISPRISIAYPITDQGVIRFSYGHFYQIGNLQRLYTNNNFRVASEQPIFGNADVKPQRSVQYEMGLQQGLSPDLRLEVVGFYKDVRDYIFRQIVYSINGRDRYEALTNLDYSNTRGITISLYQRRLPGSLFSSSVDYTFSVAEGNRTAPREDFFFSEKSGKSAETFLVPVSFDRTHVLNASFNFSDPDNFSISNIVRLQSGAPYTASIPTSLATQLSRFIQNSSNKPFQWSVDLKAEKYFVLGDLRYSLFLQIDNIFDVQNEIDVYSNSGDALYNANQIANAAEFQEIRTRINKGEIGLVPLSAVDNFYVDPRNVSRPRLVRFGFSVLF